MWLFTQTGFVSIVQNEDDPTTLIVRGRVAGDIESLLGEDVEIIETTDRDYRFRTIANRKDVEEAVKIEVSWINYGNFKSRVHESGERDRDHAYMDVWSAMNQLQHNRLANDRAKTRR